MCLTDGIRLDDDGPRSLISSLSGASKYEVKEVKTHSLLDSEISLFKRYHVMQQLFLAVHGCVADHVADRHTDR